MASHIADVNRAGKEFFPQMPLPADLTFKFLGTFARSEYALKASGFAKGGKNKVDPDWDKFSDSIDSKFKKIKDDQLVEAVDYLLTSPPRKQVLRDGRVEWKDSPPDKKLAKATQVLIMVRRVRNNLFHGAKIWSPEREFGNRDRDIRLVESALVVLEHCMQIDQEVCIAYRVGAF